MRSRPTKVEPSPAQLIRKLSPVAIECKMHRDLFLVLVLFCSVQGDHVFPKFSSGRRHRRDASEQVEFDFRGRTIRFELRRNERLVLDGLTEEFIGGDETDKEEGNHKESRLLDKF